MSPSPTPLHLLVQYYNDADPLRQREIDVCFEKNLANPHVAGMVHFQEPQTQLPPWLAEHPKFSAILHDGRLTYASAVEYANQHLVGQLVCLANADIFLHPHSPWSKLHRFLSDDSKAVAALSRLEFDGLHVTKDPVLGFIHYAAAQDAWMFVPPLTGITGIDFPIGTLGCDNAFAYRLVQGGLQPYNLANEYKIFHYDTCRGKRGFNATTYHNDRSLRGDSPELQGHYFLPEFGAYPSLDKVAQFLKLSEHERYKFVCDMLSHKLKVDNSLAD